MRFQLSLREPWRRGEHELLSPAGLHFRDRRHQLWHVMSQFRWTATRQNSDDGSFRIKTVARGESVAADGRAHSVHKRVSNPVRSHARLAVEILLEGKNAQPTHEAALHQPHPPRPPGPELRTNKIDIPYMLAAENTREAQVKCGKIRQNRNRWTALVDFGDQAFP